MFCDYAIKFCSTASLCLPAVRVERLKSGTGGLRAVGQPVVLTHGFQEFAQHVQPLQKHTKSRMAAAPLFARAIQ